jgi:hypothetical protein
MTRVKKQAVAGILLLIIIFILVAIYRWFNPALGFKYYEPSYLPPGVSIKEKRIAITRGYIDAEQNFRTVDWVYQISEFSAKGKNLTTGAPSQDYDANSINPTCKTSTSTLGQLYLLCHWVDYGKISVFQVRFIKKGTYVDAQIPTTLQQKFDTGEINNFVDSFKSKRTFGMPVLRSNAA